MTTNPSTLAGHEVNRLVKRLEAVRDAARAFVESDRRGDLMLTYAQWEAYRRMRTAIEEADRS